MAECGEIDLAKWRQENRMPAHRRRTVRWLIRVPMSEADAANARLAPLVALELLRSAFAAWQNILFRSTAPTLVAVNKNFSNALEHGPIFLLPPPTEFSASKKPHVWATVDVRLLGPERTIPRPTFRLTRKPDARSGRRLDALCPIDVDIYVAGEGKGTAVAEDEPDPEPMPPLDREVKPGSGIPGIPDLAPVARQFATAAKVVLVIGSGVILWQLWAATQDARARIRG